METLDFTLRVRADHLPSLDRPAVEIEIASLNLCVGADTVVEAAKKCALALTERDYATTAADVLVALESALCEEGPWPNPRAN